MSTKISENTYQSHTYPLYINGEWKPSASEKTQSLINPATEKEIGQVTMANSQEIEDSLKSAQAGLKTWSKTPAPERANILKRACGILESNIESVSRALTEEQGKTLQESRGEMQRAIETLRWTADHADHDFSQTYEENGIQRFSQPTPVGVVAAFAPWNYPAVICVRKIAPALAAGCSVILKAAEEAPAPAVALVDALHQAGLPKGVLSLLFGQPAQISEQLLGSPIVRKITFTGSTPVGKHLAKLASEHLIQSTLELGGHAPVIVDETVDIEQVVQAIGEYKFECAGQSCNAPSRIYVHESIFQEFNKHMVRYARSLQVGNGLEVGTTMGPMANQRRVDAMKRLIDDAVENGAQLLTGGKPLDRPGFFWEPTILTNPSPDAAILWEEPFGPVLTIMPYTDLEEAIAQANQSDYGLAGYGFSQDSDRIQQITNGLEVGYVGINQMSGVAPNAPACGIKASGYGFEGGLEGIKSYLYPKLITQL